MTFVFFVFFCSPSGQHSLVGLQATPAWASILRIDGRDGFPARHNRQPRPPLAQRFWMGRFVA
jgi:hypothetical protein